MPPTYTGPTKTIIFKRPGSYAVQPQGPIQEVTQEDVDNHVEFDFPLEQAMRYVEHYKFAVAPITLPNFEPMGRKELSVWAYENLGAVVAAGQSKVDMLGDVYALLRNRGLIG